ncbi:hypothetical protein CFELI_12345 [Corynebacterium felinum]|uniref:Uncharacterized protein n=1 Tax=Corynebacterium felinum TaxID=131318 RepID=A0ABU2B6G6_9CORY|nr:hypothetical protein [Corynebacterium felinum]WJY96050.1 hypothetical protein CFELI_12345 [Corynebacterium felinum]
MCLNWCYVFVLGVGNMGLSNNAGCEVCEKHTGIHPMAKGGREQKAPTLSEEGVGALKISYYLP